MQQVAVPIMYYDDNGEGPIIGIGSPQQSAEVKAALTEGKLCGSLQNYVLRSKLLSL